jgi:hypothetical protein
MSEDLIYNLLVKQDQLNASLVSATKKSITLEGVLESALGVFGGNIITKGFETIVSGFDSIIEIGREAIAESAQQEVAINNLNNALARQGNFTKQTSDDLLNFANTLAQTSVYQGDVVISNTALLASLTKLDNEGLKKGIQSASDFATVLGIDLETATRLVAKSAEGNTEAFKKYGVEIQKGANDSQSFANTIEALNAKFGGASASQLNTYSGAVTALGNSYQNLLEPIGDVVVKNPLVIASISGLKSIIETLTSDIEENKGSYIDLVKDGILYSLSFLKTLADAMDGITIAFKAITNVAFTVGSAFQFAVVQPLRLVIDALIKLGSIIPGLGDSFKGLTNPLDGLSNALKNNVKSGIDGVKASADDNVFTKISTGIDNFTNKIIDTSAVIQAQTGIVKNADKERLASAVQTDDAILTKRRELTQELAVLKQQQANEEKAFQDQLDLLEIEDLALRNEATILALNEQKLRENEVVLNAELAKAQIIDDAKTRELAKEKAYATKKLADERANGQKEIDLQKQVQAQKVQDQQNFLNLSSSLANSQSKELAMIGKASALTQIAIQTPPAVAGAYRFGAGIGGPILGATFGAIAGIAMAQQASKVAGIQFEQGGIVGQSNGASVGPDNRVATVRDGEMILNANQQKNLFDMINGGLSSMAPIIIQVDGKEIARAVRNQVQQGYRLA